MIGFGRRYDHGMCSTTIAMILVTVLTHRHSDGILGPDLALNRPTTSRQSDGGEAGPYRATMTTDADPSTFWRTSVDQTTGTIEIALAGPRPVDHVVLAEPADHRGRIRRFTVQARTVDGWTTVAGGGTIGSRRVLQFPAVMANRMRVTVERSSQAPALSKIGVHSGPPSVAVITDAPSFLDRTTAFLASDRDHAKIFYTIDGSVPNRKSRRYRGGPIVIDRDLVLRAAAYEGDRPGLDYATTSFKRYRSEEALQPRIQLDHSVITPGVTRTDVHMDRTRIADRIHVVPVDIPAPRRVVFEGLLRIPRDGVFTLHTETDGTTTIRIDRDPDHEWTSTSPRSSLSRPFRSGWHPIRIEWSGPSDAGLEMEIEGPGLSRRAIRSADLAVEIEP